MPKDVREFWHSGAKTQELVKARTAVTVRQKGATVRHSLTDQEKLKGVRAALASPRTPQHLKSGLKRHLQLLEQRLAGRSTTRKRANKRAARRTKQPGFIDWIRL